MSNITPIRPQAYRLDLESLNDLAKMSRELCAYLDYLSGIHPPQARTRRQVTSGRTQPA